MTGMVAAPLPESVPLRLDLAKGNLKLPAAMLVRLRGMLPDLAVLGSKCLLHWQGSQLGNNHVSLSSGPLAQPGSKLICLPIWLLSKVDGSRAGIVGNARPLNL